MGATDLLFLAARRAVRDVVGDAPRVVVGVSGGADSLALAAAVARVASDTDLEARAVVVDHGLQEGSDQVAARAAEVVRGLGLPAVVVRVDVGDEGGPEAAARRARRDALEHVAGDDVPILLAHTRDDQAETVLLGLGRGSGARSLRGMHAVDGPWRRPFLGFSRADTEALCTHLGLSWWTDPHNSDPAFRRARIRHEAMPLLEEVLGGGVAEALARTAEQVHRDNDALDAWAADHLTADTARLAELHPAVRSRVLRLLALDAGVLGGELRAVHLAEMERLVTDWHGQARVELPGHVSVTRVGNRLCFGCTPVAP